MVKGIHYEKTFSLVLVWSTVRLLLTLSDVYEQHTKQINLVLVFPQADVKVDACMQIAENFKINEKKLLVLNKSALHPMKQHESKTTTTTM